MLASASRRVVVHQQLLPKSCLCGRPLRYSSRQDQAWWDEELDRRRRGTKVGRQEAVKQDERKTGIQLEAQRRPERQEIQQSAAEMQLFASAESQRPPWAVIFLLLASGGLTAAATALWAKVSQSQSLEELQEELQNFCWVISGCSVSLPQLQAGEVHRLLAASLLRAGERPARLLTDTVLFFCCGTLLERLYGSTFLLQLILGSTVFSNVAALYLHQHLVAPSGDPAGSISSSSAAVVTLGTFCALRHGRWAAWRGVPVPISWLMAPVLVADLSLARAYLHDFALYRAEAKEAEAAQAEAIAQGSGIQRSIALAACLAVEDAARSHFRPPAQDIVCWRIDLEITADEDPPALPEATVLADAVGAFLGAGLAAIFARASRA
eukprot:s1148_g16.t1